MGMKIDFSEVENKLYKMSNKMKNQTIDKALDAGAEVILEAEKKNVPVDTHLLQSRLGTFGKKGNGMKRSVDIGISDNKDRVATYGYYQEYGYGTTAGKKWMKKSFKQSSKEAVEKISGVLKEELEV